MGRKPELMSFESLDTAAVVLKIMSHPIRLRIVEILMQGRFPVHEVARRCELSHSQTCNHLRLMKGTGLLDSEREGRSVYYKIVSPRLPSLIKCVKTHCWEEK